MEEGIEIKDRCGKCLKQWEREKKILAIGAGLKRPERLEMCPAIISFPHPQVNPWYRWKQRGKMWWDVGQIVWGYQKLPSSFNLFFFEILKLRANALSDVFRCYPRSRLSLL